MRVTPMEYGLIAALIVIAGFAAGVVSNQFSTRATPVPNLLVHHPFELRG